MTAQMVLLLRCSLSLNQQEFADKIFYSVHSVQAWEQAVRKPSAKAVKNMRKLEEQKK